MICSNLCTFLQQRLKPNAIQNDIIILILLLHSFDINLLERKMETEEQRNRETEKERNRGIDEKQTAQF